MIARKTVKHDQYLKFQNCHDRINAVTEYGEKTNHIQQYPVQQML